MVQPRERYLTTGPGRAGDAELLALVLGTGLPGTSALGLAAGILERFGDLKGVANAGVHELCGVRGVGPARAVRLHAALHAGRRSLGQEEPGIPVRTPADAHRLFGPRLRGLVDEELHGIYLDRRRRLVAYQRLTRGSDAFTIVDPRQIYREAIRCGASAVLLAHNHPSCDPAPSPQDRDVTRRVARAGSSLGVPLLDHLVIADERYVSMAEEGGIAELGERSATASWVSGSGVSWVAP